MFCPKCGNEIPGNAKFCGKCGAVVSAVEAAPEKQNSVQAGETKTSIHSFLNQIGKLWSDYMGIWRRCGTLDGREKGLWFGIHGAAAVLLLCIILVPTLSGGRDKITDAFYAAAEDGECNEEEIIHIAQLVTDYEEISLLEELSWNMEELNVQVLNAVGSVAQECRKMSELGTLTEKYDDWYDRDGLTEKLYGIAGNMDYLAFSDGFFLPIGNDTELFQQSDAGYVDMKWYTYAGSDKITFVKTVQQYADVPGEVQRYDGRFEISDGDILITLDGEQYRLSEADTDIAVRNDELFRTLAQGTWGYSQEFYDLVDNRLGAWESFNYPDDMTPLYLEFFTPTRKLTIMGEGHVYMAQIIHGEYEQGEGKTAAIVTKNSRLDFDYEKSGDNLIITVDGTDYVFSPRSAAYANPFGYIE